MWGRNSPTTARLCAIHETWHAPLTLIKYSRRADEHPDEVSMRSDQWSMFANSMALSTTRIIICI